MKKALAPVLAALSVLTIVILIIACEDEDVGIPCKMEGAGDAGTSGSSQINPQAMDCRSRLCLLYGGVSESKPMCTTICDSDDDCPGEDDVDTCPGGFKCIPAIETGTLRCCKMCVCERFTTGTDAGAGISAQCNTNPNPNCPDL